MVNEHTVQASSERGITILLVALAMTAILAMAAIAIDIISLYVAHGEAQRAADAGALAGAQMLVAAGVTADPSNTSLQTTAQTLATQEATNIAQQNLIGGIAPTVSVNFPNSGASSFGINPQVSVSVTRSNPPVFFGRIWQAAVASVSATATAEAFNPSNSSSVGAFVSIPVAPQCVKPWVIPNCDPNHNAPANAACGGPAAASFFDPTTGAISNPGLYGGAPNSGGVIGEPITLVDNCKPPPGNLSSCAPVGYKDNPPQVAGGGNLEYIVAAYSTPRPPSTALPSCHGLSVYRQNIEACNPSPFSCTGANNGTLDFGSYSHSQNQNGVQCLIHGASGGEDSLDQTALPGLRVIAGGGNPVVSIGSFVSTSTSIVTIPIYDSAAVTSSQINIIGFMQAFINNGGSGSGDVPITVLNISGCGTSGSAPPVLGGRTPIAVRLIQP
jgi:putative Flp pilus-assembly TadE/G-like protein